jgi:8-oxo-dGTP diphosphatase
MARPRVAAGLLIQDRQGRVLLVRPTYKEGWDIPGGYVEPGESPAQAAAREVIEEIGATITPGRLLVVDWAPHPGEGDKLLFVFDGGVLTSSAGLRPDGREIVDIQFQSVTDFDERMPGRLARRLRLAVHVNATSGSPVYAEHGQPLHQAADGSQRIK